MLYLSRSLVNATVDLATVQPRAIVHAVILPVVRAGGGAGALGGAVSAASASAASSNQVASIACIELAARPGRGRPPASR